MLDADEIQQVRDDMAMLIKVVNTEEFRRLPRIRIIARLNEILGATFKLLNEIELTAAPPEPATGDEEELLIDDD